MRLTKGEGRRLGLLPKNDETGRVGSWPRGFLLGYFNHVC